MISISLCMIVKNEEQSLGRCLHSVREVADEIVIVDTGSTDRTKEIAASFGAKIYDFTWIDNFGAARNFSFSKATQSYILWLDADDVFEEVDRLKLIQLKATLDPTVDSVTMNYHLSFNEAGQVTASLRRNRLVRRDRGFQWEGPVHEVLIVGGHIFAADIAVTHKKDKEYTDRNLRIYRKREADNEDFSPRDLYYFANELRDHGLHYEAIVYYERFLNTKKGWIEDVYSTCLKLGDCYGALKDKEMQIRSYFRALNYDKPRAEMCCRVGAYFLDNNAIPIAIYWYETATNLGMPQGLMGNVDHAAWTWLPHLQLCLCYDRLGDKVKANLHNEKAFEYHPTHPSMIYNRSYFAKVLPKESEK
ncbi:tetratricopeptide repeat-containing glycosyltransferase family 2 protein [Paenibacillus oryzisoli]|uniref:Glycosyl transferase n=1 Tax=Paenibacillus oryzisoli TaxID=1850517 RepID=A0A198A5G7_9BACL|nr:glycosyltransferase family 2 protein [Paenibacillus oryzisoli]OAS16296.1 glycosyl transferase [Paenibacillus oryzisoli]